MKISDSKKHLNTLIKQPIRFYIFWGIITFFIAWIPFGFIFHREKYAIAGIVQEIYYHKAQTISCADITFIGNKKITFCANSSEEIRLIHKGDSIFKRVGKQSPIFIYRKNKNNEFTIVKK